MTLIDPLEPKTLPPGRLLYALLLGLAVAGFHLLRGMPLSHSVLMQSFNWLFDFDTSRFVAGWCKPGIDVAADFDIAFLPRHLLSIPTRPLCLAIAPFTAGPGEALMILTALCGGFAAAVAYALAASFCAAEFDRVLLAVGYAVSVHPLMLGVIPETYAYAMVGIGVHLALLARHPQGGLGGRPSAVLSLFLNLGFTITNSMLNLLTSAVMSWRRMSLRRWIAMEARVWLIGGAVLLLVTLAATAYFAPGLLGLAGSAPKRVWWIVNINRGEPASLLMVLCTFFLYSFVAPALTTIDLPAPDSHPMVDFRAFQFGITGSLALAMWCVALLMSGVLAWRGARTRRFLIVATLWMLFNICLHWYWQYRASIYLYGAHSCFVLFFVLAMGYGAAIQRYRVQLVRVFAVLLVALTAINNLGIYSDTLAFVLKQPLAP